MEQSINKNSFNPLVSIIVVIYNSSRFVIETLESTKAQTYQNIELIVSDDCSTDNTVEICREWIESNKDRFVRTKLITVESNTGIPANCNRGVRAAQGEWLKMLAGDDALCDDAIERYVYNVTINNRMKVVQANSLYYSDYFLKDNFKYLRCVTNEKINKLLNSDYQLKVVLWSPSINSPTLFIHNSIYKEFGQYDENSWQDDWPFWIKLLSSGIIIYSIDETTVKYRVHSDSISNQNIKEKIFSNIYIKLHEYEKEHLYDKLTKLDRVVKELQYRFYNIYDKIGLNKNHLFLKGIFYLFTRPFIYYNNIRLYLICLKIKYY